MLLFNLCTTLEQCGHIWSISSVNRQSQHSGWKRRKGGNGDAGTSHWDCPACGGAPWVDTWGAVPQAAGEIPATRPCSTWPSSSTDSTPCNEPHGSGTPSWDYLDSKLSFAGVVWCSPLVSLLAPLSFSTISVWPLPDTVLSSRSYARSTWRPLGRSGSSCSNTTTGWCAGTMRRSAHGCKLRMGSPLCGRYPLWPLPMQSTPIPLIGITSYHYLFVYRVPEPLPTGAKHHRPE